MKLRFAALALLAIAAVPGISQSPQPGGTDYTATSITFPIAPPQKVDVNNVSITLIDNPGPATYCYWIVANFLIGNASPSSPACITNGPNALVSGIRISWGGTTGALSYDVLRTSNQTPPAGACACAVATGVTTQTAVDTGLNAYTVNTFTPGAANVVMSNQPFLAGVGQLSFRNQQGSILFGIGSNGSITGVGANAGDHIQYVSPFGNNANDGLSWSTAKLTCAAAIAAIGSNTGRIIESPALGATECVAGTGAATGLNGFLYTPTRIFIGPSAQATNGSNKNSFEFRIAGSLWNGAIATDDFYTFKVFENSTALTTGSDFQLNHSSVSGGSGRFLVNLDMVIGPPGSATNTQNFNSFAQDLEGSYWDGANSQFNLIEMGVTTTPASGTPINSRFNVLPIFTGACVGCTSDFAIGASGTLSAQGDYSGPPMWRFIMLPRDGFTATFNHTLTANRNVNTPDADSTTVQTKTLVAHQFVTSMSAQGVLAGAQPASADISDGTGSGVVARQTSPSFLGQVTVAAASAPAPSIVSPTDATTGPYFAANGDYRISAGGNDHARVEAGDFTISSADCYRWGSAGVTGADTTFGRVSAAAIELGCADVAGPSTYTIQGNGGRAGTDTNTSGKAIILQAGTTTGNATPPTMIINAPASGGASGSAAATQISRFVSNDTKSLTTGAAATLLSVPLATTQMAGGKIDFYLEATDGTNQCTLSGTVEYAAENSAGVFVTNTSVLGTSATACTAGKTLTASFAVTSANPALVQVTPTLTGITASRFTAIYSVQHMGQTQPTF